MGDWAVDGRAGSHFSCKPTCLEPRPKPETTCAVKVSSTTFACPSYKCTHLELLLEEVAGEESLMNRRLLVAESVRQRMRIYGRFFAGLASKSVRLGRFLNETRLDRFK